MVTIQELIERKRILEEAKRGIRKERVEQIKQIPKQFKRAVVKSSKTLKFIQRNIKAIPKGKVASKQFSSNLMRMFGGTSQGQKVTGKVGRPKGQFKNPVGVPAQVWYKIQRQQRRLAQIQAERIQQARFQALAQRGISPQQAQIMQQQRLQAQIQAQQNQPQTQVQPPQQMSRDGRIMSSERPSIWNRQGTISEEVDLMGNIKQKIYGRPESFWN